MAVFMQDPTDPNFVIASDTRIVPRDQLDPSDTVVPATTVQPQTPSTPEPQAAPAVPPRAQALLAKRDAVLGPSPLQTVQSTTTTNVQRGIAPSQLNPVLDANRQSAERQAAQVEEIGAAKSKRAEDAAMVDATNAYGRYQVSEEERRVAAQRAEIARQNELAISLQKDPDIDPDRFVKNMTTGQSIGTIILAALNGAFRGMQGQKGDIGDMLQDRINKDIEAQKEGIRSGRIQRSNLIAYFQRQGMNEEAAEKAARATSWAMLDRLVQAEKDRLNAPEAKEQAQLLGNQIRSQVEQNNNQLRLSLGTDRVSSQTSTVRQRPQPAGSGDILSQLKTRAEMLDHMDAAEVSKAVGREVSPAQAKELKKGATDYAQQTAVNKDLMQRIQRVADLTGHVFDPKTNRYIPGPSGVNRPRMGTKHREINMAYSALKEAKVMRMPREPANKLQEEFGETIEPPFFDNEIATQLNQLLDIATSADQNLRQGYGDAVKLYDSRGPSPTPSLAPRWPQSVPAPPSPSLTPPPSPVARGPKF